MGRQRRRVRRHLRGKDQPNGYPVDYQRTRIVGKGTPNRNFQGIFQDKPMLEVDRTGGEYDGNVYVCWSRFTGHGQNKHPIQPLDGHRQDVLPAGPPYHAGSVGSVQGCDIAVEADGDVYVTYRTFPSAASAAPASPSTAPPTAGRASATRGSSATSPSTSPPTGARDCGDGPYVCPSEFVFHRVPLEPRVTSDQSGELPTVSTSPITPIRPGVPSRATTSYNSAGPGR